MPDHKIPYDEMVQDALLGVVRQVLKDAAQQGLPGAHHFYIAFRTEFPGVDIPAYLKERYKEEMTIVLQNQFWDLKVEEDFFQVGLSFNQKPAMLTIPFAAVTGFLDPSVEFGLQFQKPKTARAAGAGHSAAAEAKAAPKAAKPAVAKAKPAEPAAPPAPPEDQPAADAGGEANVVTLDAFRKKK